jgi:hypothetical protein
MTLITNFTDGSTGRVEGDAAFIALALSTTDMESIESYTVIR